MAHEIGQQRLPLEEAGRLAPLGIVQVSARLAAAALAYAEAGADIVAPAKPYNLRLMSAMICLPWKRPFSIKISLVCSPDTTTPAT